MLLPTSSPACCNPRYMQGCPASIPPVLSYSKLERPGIAESVWKRNLVHGLPISWQSIAALTHFHWHHQELFVSIEKLLNWAPKWAIRAASRTFIPEISVFLKGERWKSCSLHAGEEAGWKQQIQGVARASRRGSSGKCPELVRSWRRFLAPCQKRQPGRSQHLGAAIQHRACRPPSLAPCQALER